MNTFVVAVLAFLLFWLLLTPILMFLTYGWCKRRREIMCLFTDSAIKKYFRAFFPAEEIRPEDVSLAFEKSFYS